MKSATVHCSYLVYQVLAPRTMNRATTVHFRNFYSLSYARIEGAVAVWLFDKGSGDTVGPLTIGATFEGTGPVKGIMDDVGLFNEALSEDEISSIMNDGLRQLCAVHAIGKLAMAWGEIKNL